MSKSEPAAVSLEDIERLIIGVTIALALLLGTLWAITHTKVQRIEQKVNQCH